MCERRARPGRPRPRWRVLYGIVGAAALTTAVTRAALSASLFRAGMLLAIPALGAVALAAWVLTNRVALDLTDWCDCAGRTVRVRIVAAPSPPRPSAPDPRSVERATLRT